MTSADHAKAAKVSFDEWCRRLSGPRVYRYKNTEWYRAGKALEAETHPTHHTEVK